MTSDMCELEKAYWDWFLKIKSHRSQLHHLPLAMFMTLPEIQAATKRLGELHRELTEKELWQELY